MKKLLTVGILLMFMTVASCGSTYTLKKGGWAIERDEARGTCLTVHGDGDPEVVVVCILAPEAVKLSRAVLEASCPACVECPAEEKTDGPE